jgi:hypothetical protein
VADETAVGLFAEELYAEFFCSATEIIIEGGKREIAADGQVKICSVVTG